MQEPQPHYIPDERGFVWLRHADGSIDEYCPQDVLDHDFPDHRMVLCVTCGSGYCPQCGEPPCGCASESRTL